jgi:hypothetical protein
MLRDCGELSLNAIDDANIPVVCFLHEPDDDSPLWRWTADNFMPRKAGCSDVSYALEADTKEEILEAVRKHVVPLYRVALQNLEQHGANYYWKAPLAPTANRETAL